MRKPGRLYPRALVVAGVLALLALPAAWTPRDACLVQPDSPPGTGGCGADEVAVDLADGITLLWTTDTRPDRGKIAPLQKGALVLVDGVMRTGEGWGLGAPIAVAPDNTTFVSAQARLRVGRGPTGEVLWVAKDFEMQRSPEGTGRDVSFQHVGHAADATVVYVPTPPGGLRVTLRPGWVREPVREWVMAMELEGRFRHALLGNGTGVTPEEGWTDVGDQEVTFDDLDGTTFTIRPIGEPGHRRFIGWEQFEDFKDWGGADLMFDAGLREATVETSIGRYKQTLDHAWMPTAAPVISSPAVADLDGDGRWEIAIGSWDGGLYLLDPWLEPLAGWPQKSPGGFFASPALADLTGDGVAEIVAAADAGTLHAWRMDGTELPGFPIDHGGLLWSSPVIWDSTDGPRIIQAGTGQVDVVGLDGQPAPGWPRGMAGWADSTPAVGHGIVAVATLTRGDASDGWLNAWRAADGTPLEGFPVHLGVDSDSSPALGDLDGDGQLEIVVGDDSGSIHVFDLAGRPRPRFPFQAQDIVEASPALADLTGDGRLEIVIGSWDGNVYALDADGDLLPGWPRPTSDHVISSAALADVDGDGSLDVVVGSKDRHLHAWHADGSPVAGFPVHLGHQVHSSPWVGDLDGDGRTDIVVGANNGVHVINGVGTLGEQAWPMFRGDTSNTGSLG